METKVRYFLVRGGTVDVEKGEAEHAEGEHVKGEHAKAEHAERTEGAVDEGSTPVELTPGQKERLVEILNYLTREDVFDLVLDEVKVVTYYSSQTGKVEEFDVRRLKPQKWTLGTHDTSDKDVAFIKIATGMYRKTPSRVIGAVHRLLEERIGANSFELDDRKVQLLHTHDGVRTNHWLGLQAGLNELVKCEKIPGYTNDSGKVRLIYVEVDALHGYVRERCSELLTHENLRDHFRDQFIKRYRTP